MTTRTNSKTPPAPPCGGILQALPTEIRDQQPAPDPLADLLAQISRQKVPLGSLNRMWALGSMQAKITLAYLAFWLRSGFADANEKQRLRNDTHLQAALKLLGTMGYLRGAVMKIGQMLGNLPELLPEEFGDTLATLHFEAPPMHYALIREVLRDELGGDPGELFAYFERQAFAAASLGQVHRARLKSGEEVAVKIQYPNIAATIRADMRNLRTLLKPMRLAGDWQYLQDNLDDLEEMLLRETDYRQEAQALTRAGELFQDEGRIIVPALQPEFSSRRVLTMQYLPGQHLQQFLASNPTQERRDHCGAMLYTALTRLWYGTGAVYADPHPGNFLFLADGRLGLLDFGCTRTFTQAEWQLQLETDAAVLSGDTAALDACIAKACRHGGVEQLAPERLAVIRRSGDWLAEPALTAGPFDFSNAENYRAGMAIYLEMLQQGSARYFPVYNWTNRFFLGLRTMLYRLGARFDYGQIYRQNRQQLLETGRA
ncbi:MAG: AarF/ABC1/UbiB kinase family protein [Desulfobulbaceae bacterium]|nr:AarF/ABC1/UbiB kinase family protein [Desulfobulbaceae bacterium]